ncbi:cytochrome c biogenesis protein CcdA [Streptomyces sp. NPDC007205]|uniref:cytochrome c biogenesis CcdA family protein n=1 Tax=Streptomyces sp. NPDC007205 TaxID=3154316 RepID=UPI0033C9D869
MSALVTLAETGRNMTVLNGALIVSAPIALIGGLVSFFSPCVLPLVPGYLSYVTGVAGTDLAEARRGRMVAGASLFVFGFSAVFISTGALFGFFGQNLRAYQDTLAKVLGVLMILMGVFFMGLLPGLTQREFRFHRRPVTGLVGAPLLGALFGIGWTPCLGPTLSSVSLLAMRESSAGRGALLLVVYCIGLGIPFVLTAVAFRKALGAFGWVKRHYVWVMRLGGAMMIVTGVLLLTGVWNSMVQQLQIWSDGFDVGI